MNSKRCSTQGVLFLLVGALALSSMMIIGCSEDPEEPLDCVLDDEECVEDEECCEGSSCQWGTCQACASEDSFCNMSPECCAGMVCDDGYCVPVFGRDYMIQVSSAAVSMSHDGTLWDEEEPEGEQEPDPYVTITIDDQTFETEVVENSIFPVFTETFEARIDEGNEFHTALWDADEGDDELIVEFPVGVMTTLLEDDLREGGYEVRVSNTSLTAVIMLAFFPL